MTQLKKDLQSMVKTLNALAAKIDAISKKMGGAKKAKSAPKKVAKAVKKVVKAKPVKKSAPKKKQHRLQQPTQFLKLSVVINEVLKQLVSKKRQDIIRKKSKILSLN